MAISEFFQSLFTPRSATKCQPTHQQRRQNQNFSEQIQALNLQAIRKQHGRLDQRFQKVIQQASLQSAYRVEKYMKQIRLQLDKVDNYCNITKRYGNKQECIQEMDGLILEKFEKPFIKSQLNLYKVANICLVNGQTLGECIQQVKKENVHSLDQALKNLKNLVNINCS